MKRNTILSAITGAALLLLTAACSNDENNNEPQKEPTQAVQFSFTAEDFGEDETPTRASVEATPQIVDLGDCEAEITVENEPAAKKTRGAQTPANGHYTIRAYQAGVLKGQMKGTFSGGTFTPDGGTADKMLLPHGTYDFVAFNDDVTALGNDLTVARSKAETAMMGFANGENINQNPKQQVYFVMKRVGARLRTQFVCQKHIPNNITATLEGAAANAIPMSVAYNPGTKAYTATNGTMAPESNNSPASTEEKYRGSNYGYDYAYTSTSTNYHYFLPTTEASNLKLSFSAGTIFWNPITAAQKLNINLSMQSGKSYLVKFKLKPQYTYLMSDGTTGYFKDTAFGGAPAATAKTPIALVLDKVQGIGIALRNANVSSQFMVNAYRTSPSPQYNTNTTPTVSDALTGPDVSGYNETWNASYSTAAVPSNKVKGENSGFLSFWSAAHYNPGVTYTGTPAAKWFLPSASDWKLFYSFGFGDDYPIKKRGIDYKWYGRLIESAIRQVGGYSSLFESYWASTETTDDGDDTSSSGYGQVVVVVGYDDMMWAGWADNRGLSGPTRAFVKFK